MGREKTSLSIFKDDESIQIRGRKVRKVMPASPR
jgi:hypothetical protein